MEEPNKYGSPNDHLANERTFLAWVRTSIGIMAFGFVVVKFSLFVKQLTLLMGTPATVQERGYSAIVGIVLVAVGVLTTLLSYGRYRQTEKQLNKGIYIHHSGLLTVLTAFIIFISLLLIVYLALST